MLLVGLGNPGGNYASTRHNIGFIAVDALRHRYSFSSPRVKFNAELSEGTIEGERIIAIKPMTYMNNSGISVREACQFYKIPPEEVLVCHDDLDLLPGKVKVKKGGGHGGHNGLKSMDAHISKEYWRLRIGIGHPGDRDMVSDYVLGRFSKQEESVQVKLLENLVECFPVLVKKDHNLFMNQLANLMVKP